METVKNFKEFSNGDKLLNDLLDAVDGLVADKFTFLDFDHDGMGLITTIELDDDEEIYCIIKKYEDEGPQRVDKINVQYNLTKPGGVLFSIDGGGFIPVENIVIDQELIDNIKSLWE
jgi:hypothetical protein